jgi:hypothetical protein
MQNIMCKPTGFILAVLVLSTLSCIAVPSLGANTKHAYSSYAIIAERNIFKPLWKGNTVAAVDQSRKEELAALKNAAAEQLENQKRADEQNRRNARKQEIEQNYSLTGIIFENGQKQAILQSKNGSTHFVNTGDILEDMKVISIDDVKGEVVVDGQNAFSVTFRMQ